MLTANLFAGNRVGGAAASCSVDLGSFWSDGGYNMEDADTCDLGGSSFPSTDPGLLAPANNGGGTLTMALPSDSPAVDRVPLGTAGCGDMEAVDQRGVARPQGAGCDVGAYERE